MQNILIIYPHWPPSNLAGVHRARLIANYLHEFNWHPVVLTVHPDFYEEKPDWDLLKTVSETIEVHHVKAFNVTKPRIIGDIGLRAFLQLKRRALELIKEKKIDFIWIPIPSFYTAILGRIIYNKTKIPYGIDYIDPWVRDISNRKNVRSILSLGIAKLLEPFAVKKACLISGVSEAYYKSVLERNFKDKKIVHVGMPYGFDPNDHNIKLGNIRYPWDDIPDCIPYVYAGAFLPNSGLFIDLLFKSFGQLKNENKLNEKIRLFFLGTGHYSHKSITEYAKDHSVSEFVVEIRDRFPFLHVLNFLSAAKGVLLIGSTEKHYTASKTFQSILSKRPVFSVLHAMSTAVEVFKECRADDYLVEYFESGEIEKLKHNLKQSFESFIFEDQNYMPDFERLKKYSSRESARILVEKIYNCLVN
jgi:hypothetical protein